MKKDDTVYLKHILDAIQQIEQYLQGVTKEQFLQTKLLQDGVVRELEIIGEASRNLSEELRQKHSDIPWRQIIGMRNRIIHEYFDVDLEIVWEVTEKDLPDLKARIQAILQEQGRQTP